MEPLKEALQYLTDLANRAEKTEVLEICGKTYANRSLTRYGCTDKAQPIAASTLSSLIDYIENCSAEFPEGSQMLLHIVSPKEVRLMSALDQERARETLFTVQAETAEFQFDRWYDQERFMIELQANFKPNEDLAAVIRLAGNVERKNNQTFSDDGCTQVATMQMGVASKADVIVPNPVELIPYRTFQEVEQPASKFVFRMGDKEEPVFKIVEAEGGLWKRQAVESIKEYLFATMAEMETVIRERITVIG